MDTLLAIPPMQPLLSKEKKADGVNIQGVNETYFSVKRLSSYLDEN